MWPAITGTSFAGKSPPRAFWNCLLRFSSKSRSRRLSSCSGSKFFENVRSNSKFLYSAFYGWDNRDLMAFLEAAPPPTTITFPNSPTPSHSFPGPEKGGHQSNEWMPALSALDPILLLYTGYAPFLVSACVMSTFSCWA